MDEQNTSPIGVPQTPETNQLNPQAGEAPVQPQQEQPQGEKPIDYDYLTEEVEPQKLEKPVIDDDMTEEEIEKANQDYEMKRITQRSKASEVKSDIVDFLSSVDNPEIYREFRADVEKVAQLEGADRFTTKGLFFLVGGERLVNQLVQQAVGQIRQIDSNNRSNTKPNRPPTQSPSGIPDFLNMSNEEFREYKSKVTSGAVVI